MKRPQIPYGYQIKNGAAIPHPEESKKLRQFFTYYVYYGCSITEAAKTAGIVLSPTTLRKMLENETYLGTDFYPQLILPDVMKKAKARAEERGKNCGREHKPHFRRVPIYTTFGFYGAGGQLSASQLYDCIRPVRRGRKPTTPSKKSA